MECLNGHVAAVVGSSLGVVDNGVRRDFNAAGDDVLNLQLLHKLDGRALRKRGVNDQYFTVFVQRNAIFMVACFLEAA